MRDLKVTQSKVTKQPKRRYRCPACSRKFRARPAGTVYSHIGPQCKCGIPVGKQHEISGRLTWLWGKIKGLLPSKADSTPPEEEGVCKCPRGPVEAKPKSLRTPKARASDVLRGYALGEGTVRIRPSKLDPSPLSAPPYPPHGFKIGDRVKSKAMGTTGVVISLAEYVLSPGTPQHPPGTPLFFRRDDSGYVAWNPVEAMEVVSEHEIKPSEKKPEPWCPEVGEWVVAAESNLGPVVGTKGEMTRVESKGLIVRYPGPGARSRFGPDLWWAEIGYHRPLKIQEVETVEQAKQFYGKRARIPNRWLGYAWTVNCVVIAFDSDVSKGGSVWSEPICGKWEVAFAPPLGKCRRCLRPGSAIEMVE